MVMPLLIHGDAAFAGQGVIAECFGLSGLRGHRTGGSVHFIVNNQIGFTTYPRYSRSSPYPSDVAKMIEAPIFHVNGDDPEAVVFAAKVATEFRQKFQKPVVIDMFCYRRHGHNEGDEPSFTQPLMYKAIRAHPTTQEIYAKKLVGEGVVTDGRGREDAGRLARAARCRVRGEPGLQGQQRRLARRPLGRHQGVARPGRSAPRQYRRRDRRRSRRSGAKHHDGAEGLPRPPHHPALSRRRAKAIETGQGIDWATGEALAFCTLLLDGNPVRLSGQDSERGTFSQRHSVLVDQETENRYIPFNEVRAQAGALRGHQFDALGGGGARLRIRLFAVRAERADAVGGAVRRLRQRRAGGVRPVHLVGRAQVAAHVGPRLPAAARLRGAGAGAFLGAARALPADVRRGQHAGRQLHDAGELLPHPAPAAQARHPQAADPDDAEVAAAPQARGVAARRDGAGHLVPSPAVGRCAVSAGREDQARSRRQDPARRAVLRQGLLRSLRGAREARHRRRLSAARRAALSVPDQGAGARACRASSRPRWCGARKSRATWAPGSSSTPSSNGCSTRSAPSIAAALCRPAGLGRDRGRPDVEASRAAQGSSSTRRWADHHCHARRYVRPCTPCASAFDEPL